MTDNNAAEENSQNSKGIVKKNELDLDLDLPNNMDEINIWLGENERVDKKLQMYKNTYTILRSLNNIAIREAEKVSCRPGCYGAKQKYEETWDKLLSTESFDSDSDSK